jgi:hypothetical protein
MPYLGSDYCEMLDGCTRVRDELAKGCTELEKKICIFALLCLYNLQQFKDSHLSTFKVVPDFN